VRASPPATRSSTPRHVAQVQRLRAQEPRLAAGQQHEPVQQRLGADRRLRHRHGDLAQLVHVGLGVGQRDVGLRADDRQRRAQLVAGVGEEAALRVERAGEAVEHRVERLAQLAQLVGRAAGRQALGQALLGDTPGEARHLLHRRQRAPREQPADRGGDEQRAGQRDGVPERQRRERVTRRLRRQRAPQVTGHEPQAHGEQQRAARPEEAGVQQREAGLDAQSR
jgi:hypothetical protein